MDTIMTIDEVARFMRLHRTTIYRLLRTNDIPAFRVGKTWRFSLKAVEEWMKKSSVINKF